MLVGIFEEIEDLLQLEFGLVNAGDVPEADPVLGHLLDLLADRGLRRTALPSGLTILKSTPPDVPSLRC